MTEPSLPGPDRTATPPIPAPEPTPWTPGWIRRLVAEASTLSERLADPDPAGASDGALSRKRWDRWCNRTAGGDEARFLEQLAWDGLAPEDVRRALGSQPGSDGPLPTWAAYLEAIPDACRVVGATDDDPVLDADEPLPFERLLLPFLEVARSRLPPPPEDPFLGLGPSRDLDRELLRRLVPVVSRAALALFDEERPAGLARLAALVPGGGGSTTARHDSFVAAELESGLAGLLGTFPVAARLACSLVELWIEERAEFEARLAADLPLIEAAFGGGRPLGSLVRTEGGLSDPHGRGRSVRVLHFDGGVRVVYKPKSVAAESAVAALMRWCDLDGDEPLRAPRVIDRGGHGWVEFIERVVPSSPEEIEAYFHGAGRLLALLHATRTTDCHAENLIPHGRHLVLVDAEAVLRPEVVDEDTHPGASMADLFALRFVPESVLATGLVPFWMRFDRGEVSDISALGAMPPADPKVRAWRGIGTDGIHVGWVRPSSGDAASGNEGPAVAPSAAAFAGIIEEGFRQQYQDVAARRADLLSSDAWKSLEGATPRFVFRNTRLYMDLLRHSLEPGYLRDGVEWSIELRGLGRAMHAFQGSRPPAWPLFKAELGALEVLDIPIFHADPTTTDLHVGGRTIEGLFRSAPLDDATARVKAFQDDDLERQAAVLRAALYGRGARDGQSSRSDAPAPGPDSVEDDHGPPDFLGVARGIARDFIAHAARMDDGSVTWIGPRFNAALNRYVVAPSDYSLFSGTAGVGLFFAALAASAEDDEARAWALDSLRGPIGFIDAASADSDGGFRTLLEMAGIGGGVGTGGLVYALATSARLLDAPELLEAARRASLFITEERIEADRAYDVVAGSAGALLSLLALHREDGDRRTLETAILCGEHLLERRERDLPGSGWPTVADVHLTGMSHGAAGIALALTRLFEVNGDERLLDVALEGVAYESSRFDRERGNWRDLRPEGVNGDGFAWTWCHGAPGIGLARLTCLRAVGRSRPDAIEAFAGDVNRALDAIAGIELPVDHLCCGNMGLVDIELEASRGPQGWIDAGRATGRARNVLRRAENRGHFGLFGDPPAPVFVPGFFQGLAGVGYGALRLTGLGRLPSVLCFDPF